MRTKILKRLTSKPINKKDIYAFDVETYQEEKNGYIEQKFLMGSVVGANGYQIFKNREEMASFLTSRKMVNSLIFATNLEFDFTHVFQQNKILKHFDFIDRNGLIFAKYYYDYKKTDKKDNKKRSCNTISFLDTWNYTGKVALSKMGQLLNIPKLEQPTAFKRIPQNKTEWDEMINYNIQDSLITYKFAEFMRGFCNTLGCKYKITLASIGMDYWRRKHQPIDLFQEREEVLLKHYNAFHGGRTEIFKRGFFENCFYYDFNSHYPARCFYGIDGKGAFPNPNYSYFTKNLTYDHINEFEGVSHVRLKSKDNYVQVLGITTLEGKYIFPKGNIKGWFANIEIRKALKNGYELLNVYEGIYYTELFYPFRNAIKELWKLRRQYQKENNVIMEKMIKTLMNGGLFGKFGQKIDNKTIMINEENFFSDKNGICYTMQKGKKIILDDFVIRGNFIFNKLKDYKIPVFISPILASYTTSLARLKLFDEMNKNKKHLIYCDTDSIVATKNIYEHSTDLGELKLESKLKKAIFIKPKFYYYQDESGQDTFKTKGVGSFVSDYKTFNKLLKTRRVVTERFTKIKESGVRKLPFSSIIQVVKNLSLEDNKREWVGKFNPHIMQNSKPLNIL